MFYRRVGRLRVTDFFNRNLVQICDEKPPIAVSFLLLLSFTMRTVALSCRDGDFLTE